MSLPSDTTDQHAVEYWRKDSAAAWDKCEERRVAQEKAEKKLEALQARRFKVMDAGITVPWAMIAAHEPQAIKNHDQTFERLNERGGLDPSELLAVLDGQKWRGSTYHLLPVTVAHAEVLRRLEKYEASLVPAVSDELRAAIADAFDEGPGSRIDFTLPSGDPLECVRALGAELKRRNLHHHEHHQREEMIQKRLEVLEADQESPNDRQLRLTKLFEHARRDEKLKAKSQLLTMLIDELRAQIASPIIMFLEIDGPLVHKPTLLSVVRRLEALLAESKL